MNNEISFKDRLFPWLPYPLVMATGIGLHYLILYLGFQLTVATYVPATIGALSITFLELCYPQRREWRANSNDILNDSAYMVIVQIILPRILSFALAITLLSYLKTKDMTFENLVALQLAGFHASHTYDFISRFFEVLVAPIFA